jgi:hypothetical protein
MLQFQGDAGHEKPYVFVTRVLLPAGPQTPAELP